MKKISFLILNLILILSLSACGKVGQTSSSSNNSHYSTTKYDFTEYDGKLIGVVTGTVQENYVMNSIPKANIQYYDSYADMAIALQQGKLDAFAMPLVSAHALLNEVDGLTYDQRELGSDDIGFIFPKADSASRYLNEFNEYLASIEGTPYKDALIKKYFETVEENRPYIDLTLLEGPNGTIKVATKTTLPPFSYETGNGLKGLDLELLYDFGQKYGYAYELDNTALPSILVGVSTGVYDIGCGGIAYTEERAQSVRFSDSYYDSLQVLIIPDLAQNTAKQKQPLISTIKEGIQNTFVKESRWHLIVKGISNTLIITLGSFALATLLAVPLTMLMCSCNKFFKKIAGIYHTILQGVPVLVVLMMLYYVIFANFSIDAIFIAIFGFGLNTTSGISESMFSAINSVRKGEKEAGLALGFTKLQTFMGITFPQAVIKMLPSYRSQFIALLKGTSIVGYIAIQDITKMSDIIRSRSYDAFFPLLVTAAVYFFVAYIVRVIFEFILGHFSHKNKMPIRGVNTDGRK